MGLMDVPSGERIHIGFFGLRNAGKSSLVNAIASQSVSVVSDTKGTTTDAVKKSMELLPLGPVVLIDTPGFDDSGELGELRVEKMREALRHTDIAVLVLDSRNATLLDSEEKFLQMLIDGKRPYLIVCNHMDETEVDDNLTLEDYLLEKYGLDRTNVLAVSAKTGDGILACKERLSRLQPKVEEKYLIVDRLKQGDTVILVIPVDESAPKGRLILPQQLVLRELLDYHCSAICCQPAELQQTIENLKKKPAVVITDSQAFQEVDAIVPKDIYLTSFSILMARYKGALSTMLQGVKALSNLRDGDLVLISEACSHHRQCNDIGTVKMPGWIEKFTGVKPKYEFTSGGTFPEEVTQYKLVVHCGGCMVNEQEMQGRTKICKRDQVPIVNYGMAIAAMHGILDRSLEILGVTA